MSRNLLNLMGLLIYDEAHGPDLRVFNNLQAIYDQAHAIYDQAHGSKTKPKLGN